MVCSLTVCFHCVVTVPSARTGRWAHLELFTGKTCTENVPVNNMKAVWKPPIIWLCCVLLSPDLIPASSDCSLLIFPFLVQWLKEQKTKKRKQAEMTDGWMNGWMAILPLFLQEVTNTDGDNGLNQHEVPGVAPDDTRRPSKWVSVAAAASHRDTCAH